jgi:hypothetical protein
MDHSFAMSRTALNPALLVSGSGCALGRSVGPVVKTPFIPPDAPGDRIESAQWSDQAGRDVGLIHFASRFDVVSRANPRSLPRIMVFAIG